MATKEQVLKITILQHRNPSMTEDKFHTHWTEKHAPLASAWFARNNILGYRQVSTETSRAAELFLIPCQYHTPKATRDLVAGAANNFGWTLSSYDGHVEILVRNMDDLVKAMQDPEYPERVAPDEARFLDHATSMVTVGWEEVYVLDGKVVNVDEKGHSMYV